MIFSDCGGSQQHRQWNGCHVQGPVGAVQHQPGGLLHLPHPRLEGQQRPRRQNEQPRHAGSIHCPLMKDFKDHKHA